MRIAKATQADVEGIAIALADEWGMNVEDAENELSGRPVIKVEDYASDGPGFVGDLFVFIGGEPQIVTVITRNQDNQYDVELDVGA